LCGISEVKAKSHRNEIKALEKQRAHLQEEHSESVARLRELSGRIGRKAADREDDAEGVDVDNDGSAGGQSEKVEEVVVFKSVQAQSVSSPEVAREREAVGLRAKVAAKELARIERAIRKQRARERAGRSL
jgi:hypothetical protein